MSDTKWVIFGQYKWTQACVDLCLQHECGGDRTKLSKMLFSYYQAYRHPV